MGEFQVEVTDVKSHIFRGPPLPRGCRRQQATTGGEIGWDLALVCPDAARPSHRHINTPHSDLVPESAAVEYKTLKKDWTRSSVRLEICFLDLLAISYRRTVFTAGYSSIKS